MKTLLEEALSWERLSKEEVDTYPSEYDSDRVDLDVNGNAGGNEIHIRKFHKIKDDLGIWVANVVHPKLDSWLRVPDSVAMRLRLQGKI